MLLRMLRSVRSNSRSREIPKPQDPVKGAEAEFRSLIYLRHNARRQEHLASLGIDFSGRTVLEVGAGVGDHTTFFLDRNCKVLSLEPRPENCELFSATMAKHLGLGYDKVQNCTLVRQDVESLDSSVGDSFDIVYCYGLLYHIEDPGAV